MQPINYAKHSFIYSKTISIVSLDIALIVKYQGETTYLDLLVYFGSFVLVSVVVGDCSRREGACLDREALDNREISPRGANLVLPCVIGTPGVAVL